MRKHLRLSCAPISLMPIALAALLLPCTAQATPVWLTVVNNGMVAPTSTPPTNTPYYFSYNQPAVNDAGLVVFRARAKPIAGGGEEGGGGGGGGGGGDGTTQGIYTRDMSVPGAPIIVQADNKGIGVPAPNAAGATFVEFPSTPRIDATSSAIAFRGQTQPVYSLPDGTKTGTSGVFTNAGGTLITGAGQLGDAGFTQFAVPNAPAGTGFDQFPGAPTVTGSTVAFKGNYTVGGVAETGVFYRDTSGGNGGAVQTIARSGDAIPGVSGATFGSTAPPSAAGSQVVFTGLDNENAPTAGGIYLAPLSPQPSLTPLVQIGGAVPGAVGQTFNGFGEGLSFDGTHVGFWGSWGTDTMTVHKACPTDGNAARVAYCLALYPNGADLIEPVHQGMFSIDTQTDVVSMIAQTGVDGFTDFLNWNFSGQVDSTDAEPARWRSSAYLANSGGNVAFLGQQGTVEGLFVGSSASSELKTLLSTEMPGQVLDPMAPAGSFISSLGLERDGLRGDLLAISASMLDPQTLESWSGIYLDPEAVAVPEASSLLAVSTGLFGMGLLPRRRRRRQPA